MRGRLWIAVAAALAVTVTSVVTLILLTDHSEEGPAEEAPRLEEPVRFEPGGGLPPAEAGVVSSCPDGSPADPVGACPDGSSPTSAVHVRSECDGRTVTEQVGESAQAVSRLVPVELDGDREGVLYELRGGAALSVLGAGVAGTDGDGCPVALLEWPDILDPPDGTAEAADATLDPAGDGSGELVLSELFLRPDDPRCCPSLSRESHWRPNGDTFRIVGEPETFEVGEGPGG